MNTLTGFSKNVIALIRKIPRGKVASYGQIARLAGSPHGARGVVWILHSSSKKHKLPWHRVIKSSGHLAFPENHPHFVMQKTFLQKEGIRIIKNHINIKRNQWAGIDM
jgi:methylated-DNA-protein-cysteine methyltransferase related protein